MEPNYSQIFDVNCKKYPHYVDSIKDSFGAEDEEFLFLQSDTINHYCAHCFTALEDELFMTKGFYVDVGDKSVVFNSGCTISITPFKEDFVGDISPVRNTITGLSSTVEVEGEGTVVWSFYDDYGVMHHI